MPTRVVKHGVPARYRTPDLVLGQIRLAHLLRNKMVEVEHQYLETLDQVYAQHPTVAEIELALETATEALKLVTEKVRQARIVNQSTEPTPEAKAAVKAAKAALVPLRKARKEARVHARVSLEPLLKEAAAARITARVTARAQAVEDGLFWSTANDILRKAVAAEKLVANAWRAGKQAARRFKRWDGTGTIATQVMWNANMPKLTPAVLALPNSPRRNVFTLLPHVPESEWIPQGRRKAVVRLQVAKGSGNIVEIPIAYHRPLPDDAEVKGVQLTRRRVGTQIRHSVAITCNLPDIMPKEDGLPFCVTLGWSTTPDQKGFIHVARISSPIFDIRTAEFSDQILDVVHPGRSQKDHYLDIMVPPSWRRLLGRGASIRGLRDDLLDLVRPQVVRALTANPELAEKLAVNPADVAKWHSAPRFSWLASQWPAGDVLDQQMHHDLLKLLTEVGYWGATQADRAAKRVAREAKLAPLSTLRLWRLRDRHLEDFAAHETAQILDRRTHKWRNVAAWVCSMASGISLDAPAVAELKQVPPVEEGDTRMARQSRIQSHMAAPGELAAIIRNAAAARGITVIDAKSKEDD